MAASDVSDHNIQSPEMCFSIHMNICKILFIIRLKNVFKRSNIIYTQHTAIKIYFQRSTRYVLPLGNFIIHQVKFCSNIFWIF